MFKKICSLMCTPGGYYNIVIVLLAVILIAASCGGKKQDEKNNESDEKNVRECDTFTGTASLNNYDFSSTDVKVLKLTSALNEISGITFTPDDRLFAHGDEYADIYELDKNTGSIVKKFSLGNLLAVKGDFEDIASVNGKFYLAESTGKLYEFSEGNNGSFVEYKTYKTGLHESNNVEGLCYDASTNSLLLACKDNPGTEKKKEKAVYSFSLGNFETAGEPRFVISEKKMSKDSEEKNFSPSGIARNPLNGTFFIIASKGNLIIEISADGNILDTRELPAAVHRQAEGIAFTADGTLYISNEASGKTPVIVIYPIKK